LSEQRMTEQRNYKKLWFYLSLVVVFSFAVLGYYGREIYQQAPPIPDRVDSESGKLLFTGQDIRYGQNVWQSMSGHLIGSVWGHGAYVAPNWSADWLYRESKFLLNHWVNSELGQDFSALNAEQQGALESRLQERVRK